jgi:hypothetical protein
MPSIDIAIKLVGEGVAEAGLPGLLDLLKPGLQGLKTAITEDSLKITGDKVAKRSPLNDPESYLHRWQVSLTADAKKLNVNQSDKFLHFTHNDSSPLTVSLNTGTSYLDKLTTSGSAQEVSLYNDTGRQISLHFENEKGAGVFGNAQSGAANRLWINEVSGRYLKPMGVAEKTTVAGLVNDAHTGTSVSTPDWFYSGTDNTWFTFEQKTSIHLSDLNPNLNGTVHDVVSVEIPNNPFKPIKLTSIVDKEEATSQFQVPYSKIFSVAPDTLSQQAKSIGLQADASLRAVKARMYQRDLSTMLGVSPTTPSPVLLEIMKRALSK